MALDIIGLIHVINEDDTVTAIDGWHVNSAEPVAEWEQWLVTPQQQRRVFADADTYCYKFDSEEQFNAILPTEI